MMKSLNEYDTPETDNWDLERDSIHLCESLEQRLAACREALEFYADISKYLAPKTGGFGDLYFDCGTTAKETLTLTEPK